MNQTNEDKKTQQFIKGYTLFIFVGCGKKNAPVYEKEEEQTYYIIKNKYLI